MLKGNSFDLNIFWCLSFKSSYHHDIELLLSAKQKLDTPGGEN